MDAIPPTRAAIVQLAKRAVYQGGHCWGKAVQVSLDLPSPGDWGWTDPNSWKPLWTTLVRPAVHPGSYCTVGARKGAEGSASAREQLLDVLHCVSVVENAMRTSIVNFVLSFTSFFTK